MCEGLLVLGGGAFVIWLLYRLTHPAPPRPRTTFGAGTYTSTYRNPLSWDEDDEESDGRYRSPLGLVDRPEDEWLEWAIMEDILDGPDEGLFR